MARTAQPTQRPAGPRIEQVTVDASDAPPISGAELDLVNPQPAQLYPHVKHLLGCPIEGAPMQGTEDAPGKLQRMEWHWATVPRAQDRPAFRVVIVRCAQCGAEVRIDPE